jgi:glycosyltransferase 2 family protein
MAVDHDTATGRPGWRAALAGARPWGRHATELAAGAALLGLSLALLAEGTSTVPGWEARLFREINDLPGFLEAPLWPIMQLGNLWMVAAGSAFVWALTRRWRPTAAAATAVLLAWFGAKVVKQIVARARPADLLVNVHIREAGIHGNGYVSGHTATAFAFATVLTPLLRGRWRYVPFGVAAVVGLARIYFGAHLPLDVLGGAGLGVLCGLVASIIFGTIHPVRDR